MIYSPYVVSISLYIRNLSQIHKKLLSIKALTICKYIIRNVTQEHFNQITIKEEIFFSIYTHKYNIYNEIL